MSGLLHAATILIGGLLALACVVLVFPLKTRSFARGVAKGISVLLGVLGLGIGAAGAWSDGVPLLIVGGIALPIACSGAGRDPLKKNILRILITWGLVIVLALVWAIGAVAWIRTISNGLTLAEDGRPSDEELLELLATKESWFVTRKFAQENRAMLLGRVLYRMNRDNRSHPELMKAAAALLTDKSARISIAAARYLGKFGDHRVIPYLIINLDPTNALVERDTSMLQQLTGADPGPDREAWIAWWRENHPESDFDFTPLE